MNNQAGCQVRRAWAILKTYHRSSIQSWKKALRLPLCLICTFSCTSCFCSWFFSSSLTTSKPIRALLWAFLFLQWCTVSLVSGNSSTKSNRNFFNLVKKFSLYIFCLFVVKLQFIMIWYAVVLWYILQSITSLIWQSCY